MTTVVSFTDFRENLSKYLLFIAEGNKIEINDAKKNKKMITLIAEKKEEFDWDTHMKWMKEFKPFLTDKDIVAYKERRKRSRIRLERNNW